MTWSVYQFTVNLNSPLHIGWKKIGNLMRTRYFIPGRVWWGAITAKFAQKLNKGYITNEEYVTIGDKIRKHIIFGYSYLSIDKNKPIVPTLVNNEIKYGIYTSNQFERRFITSHVSTAINAHSASASKGMLYEVEFIIPAIREKDEIRQVAFMGHVFIKKNIENDSSSTFNKYSIFETINDLQLGGERKYGWGQVKLEDYKKINGHDSEFKIDFITTKEKPEVKVKQNSSILAHTNAIPQKSGIIGPVEPVVTREYDAQQGYGHQLKLLGLCYVPGSKVLKDQVFKIEEYGFWKRL